MCGNTFMPDSMTSACRIIWSNLRPMKIGTGSELPDTGKMWHMGKPSARRFEKWLYRCGWMALPACKPLQRLENGFRKRQNPFVGNDTSGMAKPRIRAFLRLLGLCCLNDKTSHRFQGENISDGLLSQIFERREKENEHIGIVKCLEICRAFPAHWHNKICCAFNHICKTHVETTHLSRIVYHL